MQNMTNDRLWLINERRAKDIRQAAISREFGAAAPSVRRAVGTLIVRFGTRLAGEPNYTLARSR